MTNSMIDFPSTFTDEQISYITQTVAQKAREVYGNMLCNVILYGSYARGDHKEWSDVDIMIIADTDDLTCKRLNNILNSELDDLAYHMNLLLSVMCEPYSRFERMKYDYPFYKNIHVEGKSVCLIKTV